jgi:pimeloyl-ACP methyl ester carboxylesterase
MLFLRVTQLSLTIVLAGLAFQYVSPSQTIAQDVNEQIGATDSEKPSAESASAESETLLLYGVIETPLQDLRTTIELSRSSGGKWTGISHSIDQKNAEVVLSSVAKSENGWDFEFDSTDASYSGVFDKAGVLQGNWKQRGSETPLALSVVEAVPKDTADVTWRGTTTLMFRELMLQFRVYDLRQDDRLILARKTYFDSLNEGATSIRATYTQVEKEVEIEIPGIKAVFNGFLNDEGTKLTGEFKQGFVSTDLILERVENAQTAEEQPKPNRPQTPVGEPDYLVEEFTVTDPLNDSVQLAGTLTMPKGDGPFRAVVLVSGSGPQDRDETIFDHKPFAVMADFFTQNNIAVLRYDDRGVASSTGDFASATTDDFAKDAELVFDYARSLPKIDPAGVGIIGHSEGGMIAPLVATWNSNVAFVVMLAGPGVKGADTLLLQSAKMLEVAGLNEQQIAQDQEMRNALHQLALSTLSEAEAKPKLREIIAASLEQKAAQKSANDSKVKTISPEEQAARVEALSQEFEVLFQPWIRRFLAYDPAPTMLQVRCPVLGLWGSKDVQVLAEENVAALNEVLARRSQHDCRFVILPGLNHLFQPASVGSVEEYAEIETTISPNVLDLILEFIQSI